ncbi:MAG: histidine kinase [Pseudomonadota bacterium]
MVWPSLNLALISSVLMQVGLFEPSVLLLLALKYYAIFGTAFLIVTIIQWRFPAVFTDAHFGRQLLLHTGAFVPLAFTFSPIGPPNFPAPFPQPRGVPLVFFMLQIIVYVAVMRIFSQQRRAHAMEVNLRQAQINLLRSQSNPHFLFNTLNLLGSEIANRPMSAIEIVYDLADLLRESLRSGEQTTTSIADEFRLAELYLRLQEKRFPGRFTFSLEIEDSLRDYEIPSLLLQPAIENAIKHGVARSMEPTLVHLTARRWGKSVIITVVNTGIQNESATVTEGAGLRILRETLELYYGKTHSLEFEIADGEAMLEVTLPAAADHASPA